MQYDDYDQQKHLTSAITPVCMNRFVTIVGKVNQAIYIVIHYYIGGKNAVIIHR